MKLHDYLTAKLVVTPLAQLFDFRGPGVDYKVTIDATPTAAAALVETDAISISAVSTRAVTFTPTEYGKAFQVTDKEMNRAFFNTMDNFSKKLGYSLALQKDTLAVSTLRSGATTSQITDGVAAVSSLASTNTLDFDEITKAARTIENYYYTPTKLVINNFQKEQLLKLSKVQDVSQFGTREAVQKGLIGELFGLQIFATTQISNGATSASNTAAAIMLGESGTGEQALGYAVKADPTIRTDIDILYRTHTIAAHEEYNFQVLHPNAVVLIYTYSA
jgi:HK97 family phage major capsid protein